MTAIRCVGRSLLAVAALAAAGCSGGGGGGGGGGPPDTIPPTVVSTSPLDGQAAVRVGAPIQVTFSEAMSSSTLNTSTFTLTDAGAHPVGGAVSCSGATATFAPYAPLAYGTVYTARVTTGARDAAGNAMAAPFSFTFTTEPPPDVTPPAVISTTPGDGEMYVLVGASIAATFSEAVDPATIGTATFTVADGSGNSVAGTVSCSGTTATFTPSGALGYSTTYVATIHAGVRDLAGNALAFDRTWTFYTADASTLTIVEAGSGSGTVISTPAGIACGGAGACSGRFASGTEVALAATPAVDSVFEGFSGACSTIRPACSVTLAGDASVTAYFAASSVSATGNQLGLDGTADVAVHQQIANPPASTFDISTFTIEAWVFPLGGGSRLVAADSAYYLMLRSDPLRLELAVMTSFGFPASVSFAGTTRPLELGRWNHVVGMVNGATGKLQVAVNGELSAALAFAGTVDASFPQTFSVGNSYPAVLGDYPFIGRIDEVRLSSLVRYAEGFSPAPLLDADESTVGLWHFDEPAGATTFADSSGNGNALSALGAAATVAGTREVAPVSSGSLVLGFGGGGVTTSDPSVSDEAPFDVVVASSAVYVVGSDDSVGPQWRIEKRSLLTGALSPSFGAGGVVTSNPSGGYDVAIAAVSDGTSLYVVGYDMVPSFLDYEWRIEKRLLSTGELVADFGTNGAVMVNPCASTDIPSAVVDDGTSLYVVGYDYATGGWRWRIEKRSMTTGALVAGFGTDGVVVTANGGRPTAAVVQGTSLFVVGLMPALLGDQWRIEKRSLDTGALVTDFGVSGVVSTAPATDGHPAAVATDGSSLYVAGYGRENASLDWWWIVEKRDASTGALVTAFGTDGVVSSNPGPGDDEVRAMVLDGSSLYLAGNDQGASGYGSEWRIEKRSLDTGGLVGDFGNGGVVTSDPSSSSGETATAIASDGTAVYAVGIDNSPGNSRWRIEKRMK